MAMAGEMLAVVLTPAAITRVPNRTPRLGDQLYSTAGAKPNASLGPESSVLLPVTRVLPLRPYTTSSASTQLRVRLYSHAASADTEVPGLARPRNPAPVP